MSEVSKVIYGDEVLIDLTNDTVAANKLLTGITAHGKDGEQITGTCDYDANTADGNITADDVLNGKIGYADGAKVTGTMPNIGAQTGNITTKAQTVAPNRGYHDGTGAIGIDATEQAKIIAGNIKSGVTILGVVGTYEGSGGTYQQKTATPYTTQQVITADTGFDALSQVTIQPIAFVKTENPAGGYTVTIGTVAP